MIKTKEKIMTNKFIATYLLVLSAIAFGSMITSVQASDLGVYAVIDTKGTAKVPFKSVLNALGEGKTCVMNRTSVKAKSKNITKKHCQDKDFRERYGIRVIKCSQILENDASTKCKGLKGL
jgi:hypothetical protein